MKFVQSGTYVISISDWRFSGSFILLVEMLVVILSEKYDVIDIDKANGPFCSS